LQEALKLDNIEQYRRRQNLKFKGVPVPVEEDEDTSEIIVKLAKMLKVDVTKDDTSTSHRLPLPPQQDP